MVKNKKPNYEIYITIGGIRYEVLNIISSERDDKSWSIKTYYGRPAGTNLRSRKLMYIENGIY